MPAFQSTYRERHTQYLRSFFPDEEVLEARKRVLLKRYLRKFQLYPPAGVDSHTLRTLVRVLHAQARKIQQLQSGG